MLLAPIRSFRVCISHQSDRRIRVCILHQSERRFCSLVWEVFKFHRSNGGFGESGSHNGVIFQNEKCWLFCVFNMYLTVLHEKCDTTGQMKDISLPIVNVLLMLRKWWIVVREKMQSCAPQHDHGYCSFTTRVRGTILNQILSEVLMNCTKHFDSSSSSTESLQSVFRTNKYPWHQYSLFLVTAIQTTHTIYHKIPVCELIRHFRSFPR